MAAGTGLDVHWNVRAQLWAYLTLAAFLLFGIVCWAAGLIEPWLGVAEVVVFGGILAMSAVQARRLTGSGAMLRLEPGGLVVPGHPMVPWSDIAEVRVTLLKPAWLFWVARLGPKRPVTVVAFVGRDGVNMPTVTPAGRSRWNRMAARMLYGTECLFMPGSTSVRAEDLVEAVRELGEVPVTGRV